MFGVWGWKIRVCVWGLGLRVWGWGSGVWGLGFGVSGFGVWGLGFRGSGLGFRGWVLGLNLPYGVPPGPDHARGSAAATFVSGFAFNLSSFYCPSVFGVYFLLFFLLIHCPSVVAFPPLLFWFLLIVVGVWYLRVKRRRDQGFGVVGWGCRVRLWGFGATPRR